MPTLPSPSLQDLTHASPYLGCFPHSSTFLGLSSSATFFHVSSISLHFQKPSLMSLASMGALQFSAPTLGRHLSTCLEHFYFHLSFLSKWFILPGLLLQGENHVSFHAYPCTQLSAWYRVHTIAVSRGNGWRTGMCWKVDSTSLGETRYPGVLSSLGDKPNIITHLLLFWEAGEASYIILYLYSLFCHKCHCEILIVLFPFSFP